MLANVNRRMPNLFKPKIILTVVALLLICLAFVNFSILISVRANVHARLARSENSLDSMLFIKIYKNTSLFTHEEVELGMRNFDSLKYRKDRVKSFTTVETINTLEFPRKDRVSGKSDIEGTRPSNKLILQPSNHNCAMWCHRGNGKKPPYLLTAVLLVRIYRHDLAKLSSREMIQWLQYLRYAGFQHVYIYDAYVKPSESQRDVVKPFTQSGYATYIDWSIHNPYTIQGTQVAAYQDCIDTFGKDSMWQAAIDIDEYPFSPLDLNENFMLRFLHEYSEINPQASEITMKNYLFLGKPLDGSVEPFLIGRLRRRTHAPANPLVKPIYKPAAIAWAQVHHNGLKGGFSQDTPSYMLRMNHYWGARVQNWGEDTPKVLDMTEPDYSIEPIVKRMKHCAGCLGKDGLYRIRALVKL